jgi:hypothetical protein
VRSRIAHRKVKVRVHVLVGVGHRRNAAHQQVGFLVRVLQRGGVSSLVIMNSSRNKYRNAKENTNTPANE